MKRHFIIFFGLLVTRFDLTAQLAEVTIPEQEEWEERGIALGAGGQGEWDHRLYGQISPCALVRQDDQYLLYYIGATGDRSTDGGPRARALGVAVSDDGLRFEKVPAYGGLLGSASGAMADGASDRPRDGNQIFVRTAPMRSVSASPPHE